MDYKHSDAVTLSARAFSLRGDRWNETTPNDANVRIQNVTLGAQYRQANSSMTYWATFDHADHDAQDESDNPYASETRIGLTYHFGNLGGVSSHRSLPNLGRWISFSVNEIE